MDENLVLRSGLTNLTGDETLTAVDIGPMLNPLWLHIDVPAVSTTDTLDVELEFLDASDVEQGNTRMKQITAAGHYAIPFFTRQPQLQVKLDTTDVGGGGVAFGAVKVWVATADVYTR